VLIDYRILVITANVMAPARLPVPVLPTLIVVVRWPRRAPFRRRSCLLAPSFRACLPTVSGSSRQDLRQRGHEAVVPDIVDTVTRVSVDTVAL